MGLPQILRKSFLPFFFTIIIFLTSKAHNSELFSYSDGNFNRTHLSFFTELGNATINVGAFQLTPDTRNEHFSLFNASGRVMFRKPFKLWQEQTGLNDTVASFNSTFVINISPQPQFPGEGLSFVIAPDLTAPSNSHGEWLGLTNATLDGALLNKFVAIELDTVKQDYDPDDNHMGLNINSVQSNKTVSLSNFDITIAPTESTFWTVWVQYNGSSKIMDVYMAKRHDAKNPREDDLRPSRPVLSEVINLKDYVNQYSYMGFSASTGTTAELNCVLRWNLTVEILPEKILPADILLEEIFPEKKHMTMWKILLLAGLSMLIGCVVWLVHYFRKTRRRVDDGRISDALRTLPGAPREFKFKDLKEATKNFDEKMKLGKGGFGVVYKGMLEKENVDVAVKKFSRESIKGKHDFLAELTIINRLRHKHLVRLIGWCHKTGTLLLVYEYMPNGSLDKHLFEGSDKFLSWGQRYNIISGLASALHYLHNEYDQMVIHRDLKSSNILLDSDYNARLGDFGLARAIEHGRTSYEGVHGTIGYIAPETYLTGKTTRQSDVYGFGAVVLEIVCGQRPSTKVNEGLVLVDWVWKFHRDGCIINAIDDRVRDDYIDDEARRLLLLGLACSNPIPCQRPNAQSIFQIISGSMPVPMVPQFKPIFMWPAMVPRTDIITNNTSATGTISSEYYVGR